MAEPATDEGFAKHWRRVGPLLEEIRRKELAAFDHEKNSHLIDELLEVAYRLHKESTTHEEDPITNGLVELQRKLHRGRPEINLPSDSSLSPPV